jgi:hypothetical protein
MTQEQEAEPQEEAPEPAEPEAEEDNVSRPPLVLPHIPDFTYRRD